MKIIPASDSSLLIVFGDAISLDLHDRVITLFRALRRLSDARIRNLHPGYASLLVDFDPLLLTHEELATCVRELADQEPSESERGVNVVNIPACYEGEFAPDLADVAALVKLSPAEVIEIHSSATYRVYFLGFSPGFAYLGGLPERLHVPRLVNPRRQVPAGAIAIAGSQAGVYPIESPGGWRLIGRTPLRMFDPGDVSPTRLQPGDTVRFSPIDYATFSKMASSQ